MTDRGRASRDRGFRGAAGGDREEARRAGPASAVLGTALLAALCAGLAEGLVLTLVRRAGGFTWAGPHVLWLAPVSYGAVFLVLALPLLAWAALGPRPERAGRVAEGLFPFLGFTGLAFLVPGLQGTARLLLALGVTAGFLRLFRARGRSVPRALGGAAALLSLAAAATLLPAAGPGGTARDAAGTDGARAPGAEVRAGGVNVLLVILDTVRAASLGLYYHERPTSPALERLAATSTVFDRAFAPSPWTLPSHASFFTGLPPHELSADWQVPLDDRPRTLAEAMRERGFRTAAFVANHYYGTRESGLGRGFDRYDAIPTSPLQVALSSSLVQVVLETAERVLAANRLSVRVGRMLSPRRPPERRADRKSAPEITSAFFEWLDREGAGSETARVGAAGDRVGLAGDRAGAGTEVGAGEQPFFVFLNYFDAHRPYLASPEAVRRLGRPATDLERYEAAIASLDEEVGRLARGLEERGLLDRTLLIVTSDHGELFDEHGLSGHGNSLYLPLLHVPLLLRLPGAVPEGRRVDPPVTLEDLPATVLDLSGGDGRHLPGASLRRWWTGAPDWPGAAPVLATVRRGVRVPPRQPVARGDMASVLTAELHYILNGDGREELYAYREDPTELRDLSADPAFRSRLRAFRDTLTAAGVGRSGERSPRVVRARPGRPPGGPGGGERL